MARPLPPRDDVPGPALLGLALFFLSTATVLFTLAVFRLLSFFIMPSLFFDLLFIGFPVGAFLGARFLRPGAAAFRRTLWILQAAMLLSVAATLLCKRFDYLRAHLFEVDLGQLIVQMGTFTGLFIPFFCAYGLSEYVGYRVGRERLAGRMPLVYALYLFGAAFAYVFLEAMLSPLGISRMLGIALLLVVLAHLGLSRRRTARAVLGLEAAVLLAGLALPGALETEFLQLYKGQGAQSTHDFREERGYEPVIQRWGEYSLVEVLHDPSSDVYAGFYNDLLQWEFAEPWGFAERGIGMWPILLAPPEGSVAVIGAGGGRQVRFAQAPRFDFRQILALELEPAVLEVVRGPLAEEFGRVYERERVRAVRAEARGWMEEHEEERFDLIYLPSVGGYPQMMLEPGNMIRTLDAYQILAERLTPRGILAIWYPRGLDPRGILTEQYVRTLRSSELGLDARAYWNDRDFLILATRPDRASPLEIEEAAGFLAAPDAALGLPPRPAARPRRFFVREDPGFQPIRDSQPFLAGNVRHIFSIEQVWKLGSIVGSLLLAGGGLITWSLRRRGDPGIPGKGYLRVAGLSFLIGMNFLVVERSLIVLLFQEIYVFHDAVIAGAITFLVISGLGSILIGPGLRERAQLLGSVCVVALLVLHDDLAAASNVALALPVALVTGSFFPALFEAAARNPLAIFALDAVGAAVGSLTAFILPIAFGFEVFYAVAAGVFLLTAFAVRRFFRPLERPAPAAGATASAGRSDAEASG